MRTVFVSFFTPVLLVCLHRVLGLHISYFVSLLAQWHNIAFLLMLSIERPHFEVNSSYVPKANLTLIRLHRTPFLYPRKQRFEPEAKKAAELLRPTADASVAKRIV